MHGASLQSVVCQFKQNGYLEIAKKLFTWVVQGKEECDARVIMPYNPMLARGILRLWCVIGTKCQKANGITLNSVADFCLTICIFFTRLKE